MISFRTFSISWLATIPMLLCGTTSAAVSIFITNQGFEDPEVVELIYDEAPTGWLGYNDSIPGTDAYAYNPSIVDFPNEAKEGANIVGLYGVSSLGTEKGIYQILGTNFKVGGTYQLTINVGYTNFYSSLTGYRVQLLAGNTVIAEDNNSLSPGFGVFATSTVNYVYDPILHVGLVGQPLQIRLINKNLTNDQNEVAFDDVKLSEVLENPFADAGGPYYMPDPVSSQLLLNASASLPSGNETISSYEWDLNNDGNYDITGVDPAAISYSNLQTLYGMVDGSNTIRLRVTDTAAKSTIAFGTVQLVTSTKYVGPSTGNTDTWNNAANWDNGLPQGVLDVVIQTRTIATPWSDATPNFTGNLTLQNNAQLVIGWTTQLLGSYNALGTPGQSKIFMNPGSLIITRMGGTPVFPEIQLLANASIILGTSTTGGAQAQFNYPITGAFQLQLQGNNQGTCIANLNTSNGFSSLLASGTEGGVTIKANAAGSLGTGNVTIAQRTGNTTNYAILEINAANAMADTATLSMAGTSVTRLTMNASDTIAALIINGVSQAAGTYGSLASSATNKFSWITGTGILTVATPAVRYWDINGTTAGAGGVSPAGTWNAANTFWNASVAGTGSVAAWTAGLTSVFSAGSDATGAYTVSVVNSQDIGGLIIRSGSLNLNPGSGGALRLTANSNISVDAGASTIATPINESSSRVLSKSGAGTLTLSGNLSHTGGTNLLGGNLTLSGSNAAATAATTVTNGILKVDSVSAIPGIARNVTVNSTGTLIFGSSFGSAAAIQTALNGRIVTSSAGTIAADNNASANFDFAAAGLTTAYFGSMSNVNYTGTLTPQGSTYRLRSTGGTLTMANTSALTSGRSLTTRGSVVLAANNNYTGSTTVETNSSLSLLGSTTTSGITLNTGSILTVGNNSSLGSGTLTLAGLTTLKAVGTVVTTNAVAANSDFSIAGIGTLTLGTTTINASRTITNIGTGTTTFESIINGTSNLSLTLEGSGSTAVSGNLTIVNGNLTKNGTGTLTLSGTNTYVITNINGGVLRLNGSVSGAGTTNIGAAVLQLGSNSNGGLPTGNITISNPAAFIQSVSGDRSISNNIILDNNLTFSGSNSLTLNGKLTHNNANRNLTNNINSTKELVMGNVDLSQNTTNRILTIAGSGNTVVNGIIQNGGGSTAGALVKSGAGKLTLNGANTYTGTTTVNANGGELFINGSMGASNITINSGSNLFINGSTGAGSITMNGASNLYINGSTGSGNITMNGTSKLFVNNTTGSGTVTVNNGSTLSGTGTIGGNTTIAVGGNLEFDLSSVAGSHDKLELSTGRSLTFSGSSLVTITGFATTGTYTLVTAPGGIFGPLPSVDYPDDWVASLSIVGNDLRLIVSYTGVFPNPPTLVSISDDKGGGPVDIFTPINYTVTFSEDMNATTVSSSDFSNAGTSAITYGDITETSPGVFTMQVIPTTAGTLQLRINSGANLRSAVGLNLNTTSALPDNNTLNIVIPTNGVLAVTSGDFVTVGEADGPFSPLSKTYTLSNYGNQPLNWTATKTAAWIDLSTPGGTLAANGGNTTVTVTVNPAANSLSIGGYFDTVTFTNTTPGNGSTTRGVSLTVNGLPVDVTLGNLNQTYDGTPKTVSVTTSPVKTYSLTYNGLGEAPTTAGSYDIVATVTESGYTGSAIGTLVIAKAPQTINFAALDPVGDDESSITLTATSSSLLPVSFTSSDSDVATVEADVVTIVGVGITTITATQVGDENHAAAGLGRVLTVFRANPVAVPGGPYVVSSTANLALNGSGSLPSNGQTITTYEWDLNDGNDGSGFIANTTGVTPTAITMAVLQGTYGMVIGNNAIRLRVTDSSSKTSTIVSTTVLISAPLRWDADAIYATGQTDGGGGWLSSNQWRDISAGVNVNWQDHVGKDVIFGIGGGAAAVSLPATTSVGSITFNNFSGTYDIGDAFAITINRGITKNAGTVDFNCPINLSADQTWTNAAGTLSIPAQLDLGSHTLTIDNSAQVNLSGQGEGIRAIGTGGIIKKGSGLLRFGNSSDHQYTGTTLINEGRLMLGVNIFPPGNMTLDGGILQSYWAFDVTRSLGSGAGQIQLIGGTTGFSSIVSQGARVTFNNSANYEAVWGSQSFNPDVLILETGTGSFDMNFNNKLDLNGATRTVTSPVGPGGSATATASFSGVIRNSQATPAGLTKTGAGILRLNAANTFNGGMTLQEGTLQLGNVNGLGSSVGTLTVNAGLLNLNNMAAVTVGNLTGTAGTIANNGVGASTFTIGSGGGTGGNYLGVIANNTNAGTGTLALTKTGSGSITLSGINTYTGNTNINQGKLFINGSTGNTTISVASGATLGGTGTLGGNATVAAGGKLEFRLSSSAGGHDPMNISSGKALAFSGASELTITLSLGAAPGTYVLVSGGNNITGVAPANLNLPLGCAATVSIVSNELRLVVTAIGDVTPPTLTNITDNQGGDSTILIDTLVTYTVTFNEDIDASTVSAADFTNLGTSAITIGTITETSPGVFTVQVTPTSAGSLRLRIPTTAAIQDISGNDLNTNPALDDTTIITVTDAPYVAWSNAGSFNTDTNNDGIANGLAWLLGAANPNANAIDSLPEASQNSGNLTISFRTLHLADRGTASINVQYSKDLGVTDLWASHDAEVPGSPGTSTVNGIQFVITDVAGDFLDVQATIPASAAAPGTKLFTRLSAVLPP